MRIIVPAIASAALLAGCTTGPQPANIAGALWMPEQQASVLQSGCSQAAGMLPDLPQMSRPDGAEPLLAPGDRLQLRIIGDADRISGTYVIGANGDIGLNGIGSIAAAGLSLPELERNLADELVARDIVQRLRNAVRLSLLESAGVSVAVSGAVFIPGSVRAGERAPDDRVGQREGEAFGDANVGRTLSTALRAAGGVRPDADISRIGLVRNGTLSVHDLRSGHDGTAFQDVALANGDSIIVPTSGCFDARLVRPSLVTAPGIRVHMSNLTRPANNNAGAAVGQQTASLPYGTRFLQGLVAMNCVGGSRMNAGRLAVLISRNPMTGQSVVVERAVEDLVRAADRDLDDPYLMPGDALACYDSRWMNLRDAIGMVTDVASAVTPALLLEQAVTK
ncbi:hypothetical protein GCM10009127_26360 [Alteraurantiacibacter aestuarii]|uniref:Polysaccharide biosynthesis protein n=1 Tax=Alteraurantiacibacter aestuarii TaxID=650004 RepID=A0A844ZPM6_9SPHN|nr:polysaccharide biosynthesis/export family protein [Alteraurantiacibacter aestuarii]MXO88747.1 polysaccharide biosynthesis protein [Alteraurantiacibacter aestuarii]